MGSRYPMPCKKPKVWLVWPHASSKQGSVLFFPCGYGTIPSQYDTTINVKNNHPTDSIKVHWFFTQSTTINTADMTVTIDANATSTFKLSDIDPYTYDYSFCIACNSGGAPINMNYLSGSFSGLWNTTPYSGYPIVFQALRDPWWIVDGEPYPVRVSLPIDGFTYEGVTSKNQLIGYHDTLITNMGVAGLTAKFVGSGDPGLMMDTQNSFGYDPGFKAIFPIP